VVLAFFAAAQLAAPAAVEFLLPMVAALSKDFAEMEGGRAVAQEQNARKKKAALEWGKQLPLRCHFYLIPGNC
jgi:hypothetical protein